LENKKLIKQKRMLRVLSMTGEALSNATGGIFEGLKT
jgi:hypothetical protein